MKAQWRRGNATFVDERPHLESVNGKGDVSVHFASSKHGIVTESLQMNAKYLGKIEDFGVLDSVGQPNDRLDIRIV